MSYNKWTKYLNISETREILSLSQRQQKSV